MADENKKTENKPKKPRQPAIKIDEKKKSVTLELYRANNKEISSANRLGKVGYKVNLIIERPKKADYSQEKVEAYLESYGSAEQKAEYKKACDKIGEGKTKKAGYIGGLRYFKETFKNYPEAPKPQEDKKKA